MPLSTTLYSCSPQSAWPYCHCLTVAMQLGALRGMCPQPRHDAIYVFPCSLTYMPN